MKSFPSSFFRSKLFAVPCARGGVNISLCNGTVLVVADGERREVLELPGGVVALQGQLGQGAVVAQEVVRRAGEGHLLEKSDFPHENGKK